MRAWHGVCGPRPGGLGTAKALAGGAALALLAALAPRAAAHPDDECPSGLAAARMSGLGALLGRRMPPPSACVLSAAPAGIGARPSYARRLARRALASLDAARPPAPCQDGPC